MWALANEYVFQGANCDALVAAQDMALGFKMLGGVSPLNMYAREAAAFVRLGFDGEDPRAWALEDVNVMRSNVANVHSFKWQWMGVPDHDGQDNY